MSRCFPFPPPGYEKKPIPEDANVLNKEKTREKKHKDKKDKERREGKDKKDKEKSDKKRREKKDRKEKNKDKEKHKEKDQEKGSTSGEKRVLGQSENCNGAKSHQSEKERGKEKNESSSTSADKKQIGAKSHQIEKERGKEKKQSSSTSEDKRQIGQFDYCNGDKLHQKVERSRDKRNTSTEEKFSVQIQGHTGGDKPVQVSFADKDHQDSKFQLEFNERINDEEKGSGRQLVESFKGRGLKKDERTDRIADRDTCMVVEGKEKIKGEQVDNWKIDGQRIYHEDKSNGNSMSQNLTRSIQNKTGLSNSTDKFEQRMDGKEKSKEREIDDKRRDKRKSKHKDKQSQGTDKTREKEKRKEDKAKKEHRKSNKDTLRSSNNDDTVGTSNNKTPHISEDNKNAATEGSLKKRKDFEKNGFLHEHVIRPEKLPRLSPHPLSENGQELEPSKTITPFTPQKQGADKHLEVYNKDARENGLTGQHQLPISAPQPSPVIAEASRKSPHPDMKYLSKVLSVPQVQEWSDVDDQAWLFNNRKSLLIKSEVDPTGGNQGQQRFSCGIHSHITPPLGREVGLLLLSFLVG
ncbi:hypothetical protein POM88_017985 [Heracleum sosnowskyi]|uniref:Uncharacterized protein n=1 Tax=Heracleum sosnowskyi TaxID=360622 RepID=A0AAD8MYT9_9APIA|nr:hypothetical protein POM88_017985 [Heracleum sosnowskyi]